MSLGRPTDDSISVDVRASELSPERKSKRQSSIYVLLDALEKRIKREAKRDSLQQLYVKITSKQGILVLLCTL
jgi:hypothetical protein